MPMKQVGAIVYFVVLGCVGAVPFTGGCAPSRAAIDEEQLLKQRADFAARADESGYQANRRVMKRLKEKLDAFDQGRTTEQPVADVLILSGGGDVGAFGAGFLRGWGAVEDPASRRPQFDAVTGVSTGALIAPFAFLGDDASYERAYKLYREPKSDWIQRRGLLFFLPSHQSFVSIDGLKRDIKREFGEAIVKRIIAETDAGRVLAVGTTNLDFGRQRTWDVGVECRAAGTSESSELLTDILLASSAIPGAFPPVKIGDYLYADGAVSSNILYDDAMRSERSLTALWAAEYPGVPMPLTRYWVILNAQLEGRPQITQPTWVSVTSAAISTAVRSSTTRALQNLAKQLELINKSGMGKKELRYVSVPEDWRAPRSGWFDRENMESLTDLGYRMGADPRSWQTVVSATPGEAVRDIGEAP